MTFSMLPDELREALYKWKEEHDYYENMKLKDMIPLQVINIMLLTGLVKASTTFKKGDVICAHATVIKLPELLFFRADSNDVAVYSNRNKTYYIATIPIKNF